MWVGSSTRARSLAPCLAPDLVLFQARSGHLSLHTVQRFVNLLQAHCPHHFGHIPKYSLRGNFSHSLKLHFKLCAETGCYQVSESSLDC